MRVSAQLRHSAPAALDGTTAPVAPLPGPQLFDLLSDPHENKNLAAQNVAVVAALSAAKRLRAGNVSINASGNEYCNPFGGYKQSGNGRDKSLHAFDKYTELKSTWIKL